MTGNLITRRFLSIALLMLAVGGAGTAVAQDEDVEDGSYCANEHEFEMLQLINELRAENDLEPLELSQPLGVAAELKANDMAEQDYVAHESPEGQDPEDLLEEVGYTYNTAIGENIAGGEEGAGATFDQWLDSTDHREIMLGEEFTAVGIGRAHNPDSTYDWYWAAVFGGEVGEPAEMCDDATPEATPNGDAEAGSTQVKRSIMSERGKQPLPTVHVNKP